MKISKIQEINFKLMEFASFNCFDGKEVVESLRKNKDLWRGAIMTRTHDLIYLRDVESDWNVDTLFITPTEGKKNELYELASTWNADEVDWIEGEIAGKLLGIGGVNHLRILRVWWD